MNKSDGVSDYDLLLMLKRKDENALSLVYDKYAPQLYGLIVKQVKSLQLATEILKRTFIKIWRECTNVDSIKQKLFTWLISLAHRTARIDFNINLSFADFTSANKLPATSAQTAPQYSIETDGTPNVFGLAVR